MCSHVPGKGEQMVRYYGYYSNVARGKRKKADAKANRWFVIMATIAMWRAENGKKPMPMKKFPVSWNLTFQIWHFGKTGRG